MTNPRPYQFGYGIWALALVHAVWIGTDTGATYALVAYAISGAAVAGTAWWRWFEVAPKAARKATAGRVAAVPVPKAAAPEIIPERRAA